MSLDRQRVPGVARFEPRSRTGEIKLQLFPDHTIPQNQQCPLSLSEIPSLISSPSPLPQCSLVVSPTIVPSLTPKVSSQAHLSVPVVECSS